MPRKQRSQATIPLVVCYIKLRRTRSQHEERDPIKYLAFKVRTSLHCALPATDAACSVAPVLLLVHIFCFLVPAMSKFAARLCLGRFRLQGSTVSQREGWLLADDRGPSASAAHPCQAPAPGPDWAKRTDAPHGVLQSCPEATSEFSAPAAAQARLTCPVGTQGYVRLQPLFCTNLP